MSRIRFVMLGGFLGAGKTTAIARLARHYTDQGKRVAIVTNDQAYDLVDTHSLRAQGFDVGEVPGACFCCKFNDLIETAEKLTSETAPDIVITEPVGSCTDLVATVIEPLKHLHGDDYEVAPLAVLLKPEHGRKILRGEQNVGFSPKAAYIFLKQIEEADVVVLNKIDKLTDAEREEIVGLVRKQFPNKQVLAVSAKQGDGFEGLTTALNGDPRPHASFMEVDYDVYAEGEAELGWLNCQVKAVSPTGKSFKLDDLVLRLVSALGTAFESSGAEPAHLKVLGQANADTSIANLVGSDVQPELSLASEIDTPSAELIVNARVAVDPVDLEAVVTRTVEQVASEFGIQATVAGMQRFRPGRPMPTHRMGA
jgi:Ni2+-binding GTPase involved in maturation of urease and hydrogenase